MNSKEISATCIALSEKLTQLVGSYIGPDHVHHTGADGSGWYYYIQAVKDECPLILAHYRGPLMVVLSHGDWTRLEGGEIGIDDYIDSSRWFYGYFWGGGSLIGGAYWQPLEDAPGIHDTPRISRYLRILHCRTFRHSSGYMPSEENCQRCQLDEAGCPFSTLNQYGSWEAEVPEDDIRICFVEAVADRVFIECGLKVKGIMSHAGERCEAILTPNPHERGTAQIQLNRDLLNDLLYHPEVKDKVEAMVAGLEIRLESLPTSNPAGADTTGGNGAAFVYGDPPRLTMIQRIARIFDARVHR